MASPQLENGFLRIANEIAEALMRTNLSGYQSRILWAVWRKTYGFGKKDDWMSNSQLSSMTGLRKQHVSRTVKELVDRKIVTKSGYKISFNKDYTQWRELPKLVTVTNPGYKVTSNGDNCNQSRGTQKKKIYKRKEHALSPEEGKLIEALQNIPGYPLDLNKDLPFLREKIQEFPEIDIVTLLRDWKTWLLDHPLTRKSSPRSQLGNQFKLARKWGKHLKAAPTSSTEAYTPDTSALERRKALEREFCVGEGPHA